MNPAPTVFLVDDDPAFLASLQRLLHSAGLHCAAYYSAEKFLDAHDCRQPGCLVLDVRLPGQDGLSLYESMCAARSQRSTVFISGYGSVSESVRAMKAGAIDFLVKPFDEEAILEAVARALVADVRQRILRSQWVDIRQRLAKLTEREREVMIHVVKGRLNKQIAADLGTSEKTIKVHRARAMEKMGVHSLAELVRVAMQADQLSAEAEMPAHQHAALNAPPHPTKVWRTDC